MLNRRNILIGLGLLIGAAALSWAAFNALVPSELTARKVFTEDGIAIRGSDPVAFFTQGRPVKGSADITHEWSGATWRFASAENREKFRASPTAYAPQYGGFCAWAVAAKGKLFSTEPQFWKIVNAKLYLNYSKQIQQRWEADIPGFIVKGDRSWPKVVAAK